MSKIAAILGVSALVLSTSAISAEPVAPEGTEMATSMFADPVPNEKVDGVRTGGIGYEWTVSLPHHGTTQIVGSTGGKGSYEPTFKAPNFGWMHTTDWVALTLAERAVLEITVTRQVGVYEKTVDRKDPTIQGYKTSGSELFPAMSIYKGWDSTMIEQGSFNPAGNFTDKNGNPTSLDFMDVVYSQTGETTITYRKILDAGEYSVNIGGVNALYCAETDACYNGAHGYRATFTTRHIPGAMQM